MVPYVNIPSLLIPSFLIHCCYFDTDRPPQFTKNLTFKLFMPEQSSTRKISILSFSPPRKSYAFHIRDSSYYKVVHQSRDMAPC